MESTYWRKQEPSKPLFPDIEWSRPEQKSQAGKLLIVGGNKLGFVSVATAYDIASQLRVGAVRALLPDALRTAIPPTILDTVFVPSNPSGGMSQQGSGLAMASLQWCDHCLLIGDTGRNSETAMLFEAMLATDTPLTITRDAVDLLKNSAAQMIDRPRTTLVVSFAQLQKLFQAVYFPKMLSFSMQLSLLVETLHKFTLSYPCTVVTYHQNKIVIAYGGDIITQEYDDPMIIWRGITATRSACYQLWTPQKPLEAIATSLAA